jgi:catechol 2,3-dioxygenase-like lactoylglutathione lyase family enzyme
MKNLSFPFIGTPPLRKAEIDETDFRRIVVRRHDSTMLAMRQTRIFETVLYAEDLAAAKRFYRDAIRLEVIGRGDLAVVFRCGGGVLLIFDPRKSGAPGRDVPSHGTSGAGHITFGAKSEDLDAWRQQLRKAGVSIEREVDWDEGGRSIYLRDPTGNVVELAPPTLWSGGWEF